MIRRCDLVPQYEAYREEIEEAIHRVLRSGRYVLGENVAAFEAEFAEYVGARHGVGVNSGTDALILGLSCLDLQLGDEVVTTPFTAIPTLAAIRHAGATPVFADIEPDTFLMDLNQVEKVLSSKTRVILPVHLFGNAVDVEKLRAMVGAGIRILEDCAQAHGASVRGKNVGTLGDVAAFSFYPTKNLGAFGDGGMVITDNPEFAEAVRLRRMYGMINKDEFITDGINSRLDELQAAILRVKLRHLDEMNARRRELAAIYGDLLPSNYMQPQAVREGVSSVVHVYSALCSSRRDELALFLEQEGIQTNVYYAMPLTHQRGYRNAFQTARPMPVAESVCTSIISLPFYPEIAKGTLEVVAGKIRQFYETLAE